ncbi:MAG: hypothetical protein ACREEM_39375 [Blastocatellia bacterium]
MSQQVQTLNEIKTRQFSEQLLDTINKAAIALMASIGHQTGLFDTMASLPPASSERIARVAGLNERYVREWLGAMVTGRIVEYDAANETYVLPPEHAAFLTRAASPNNMTVSLALDGEGLGAAWGEEKALELLAEAGFRNVEVRQLPHDIINNYYITTKGETR